MVYCSNNNNVTHKQNVLSSKSAGFSLIELLVILAIVAILAAMAAPSLKEALQDSRTNSLSDELTVALYLAQSEAVKRSVQVTIKPQLNVAKEWKSGWDIFADPNRNGVKDTGEELIQTYAFQDKGLTLTSEDNVFATWLGFLPSGAANGSNGISGGFKICRVDGNTSKSRTVIIQASGNVINEKGASSCP